ncbi:MAG: hypothetical protein HFI37_07740 [Lachnospiraceae bacterium]|nr:hypothetical protein [Lachnospiraceae bacterium]
MNLKFTDEEILGFKKARIGTYYIIPLRTSIEELANFNLNKCAEILLRDGWSPYLWEFDDLYRHINSIFSYIPEHGNSRASNATSAIGINFQIPVETVIRQITGESNIEKDQEYYVLTDDVRCRREEDLQFRFRCMQIVIMHTGIGFLIVGIESRSPLTSDLLLRAGYNQNSSQLGLVGRAGQILSFVDLIKNLLEGTSMTDYAGCLKRNQPECILRDTTTYSVAVFPNPIHRDTSEEMKVGLQQLCLNLRHARSFGTDNFEDVDEESFFNYAALNNVSDRKLIRWGIYTLFERVTQIIFQNGESFIDPINIYGENREDNYLPFLLIALYERYSYLFFSEMLRYEERVTKKSGDWMEEQMLRLKAFGVILPGDMTPYHNENIFLEEQRKIYDIDQSIQLIDDKIGIIKHIQADKIEQRRQIVEKVLATFGIISILCDSLGLLNILLTDTMSPHIYWVTFGSELTFIVVAALISFILYKRR